jgi:hypothetical protein
MRSIISAASSALAIGLISCGSSDSGSNDRDDGATTDTGVAGDVAGDGVARDSSSSDAPVDAKGDGSTGCATDVLAPFEGGASYYAKWSHGPPSTPDFFPISVWLQSASNATKYAAIGINQFIGSYDGPKDADIAALDAAKMPLLCDQNDVALAHLSDPILRGWTQMDEPDNAQPDGTGGYGPCIDPSVIVANYTKWTAADATRPVFISFGQGASDIAYIGRGSACASRTDMYPQYLAGADIASFDIYPVNNSEGTSPPKLWMVAQGVDNLRGWAKDEKPVWVWIETTSIDGKAGPTPAQTKMEVWSALIHGALGIGYFAHVFSPSFIEAGLLADATMANAVKDLDAQIQSLAPVLNTASIQNGVKTTSTDATIPIDTMVKRVGGKTYLFAVGMRDGKTTATFELACIADATATVIGESRSIPVKSGKFSDGFDAYAVHLYEID